LCPAGAERYAAFVDDAELLELGRISIASPCQEDWSKMTGDDRARACARCKLTVYDLSTLTALEARALILSKQGEVCVRFFKRADGTVLTRDCPVGVSTTRRRGALAGAALAVSALGAVLAPSVFGDGDAPPPVHDLSIPTPLVQPVAAPTTTTEAPPDDESWMEQRRGRFPHKVQPQMGRINTVAPVKRLTSIEVIKP
jgi:hypothetical protein